MRNKFKLSIMILAFLILLVSCGGANDGGKSDAKDGKVELRFLSWLSDQKDLDRKVADAYEKENPNVKINFEYIGDMKATEYDKKVDLMTLGGENIDIVMSSAFPQFAQRAASGAYVDLKPFMDAESLKYDEEYSVTSEVNGSTYALPGDLKFWFILINKNLLDEAGLSVPKLDWSWDDFAKYSKAMTKNEGVDKVFGSYFHVWDHFNYMGMWSTKDDNALLKSETELNFDDPNLKAWLEYRYKLSNIDKSSVSYEETLATGATYRDRFFNSKAAMIPIGSWMIPEIGDQSKYPHDFVTAFAPLPKFRDGKAGSAYVEAHYYAISKNSKNQEEAYKFIRYFTTKGMEIKGISISAKKGVDRMSYVEKMIASPEYYDLDSLKAVVNNPDFYDNINTIVPPYQRAIATVVVEESEKYYLDQISIDEAIAAMKKRGQQIIDSEAK